METDTIDTIHRNLYQTAVNDTGGHFSTSCTGTEYELIHKRLPIHIQLPNALESGATSRINIMAPLAEEESPEAMVNTLQGLIRRRDLVRRLGYGGFEKFEWYDSGAEIVYYNIPTESREDLEKMCHDFSFIRLTSDPIEDFARGREFIRVIGGGYVQFSAICWVQNSGATTELSIPAPLAKKLNIEKTLKLGKEEIGVYANRFREYVISLLEKSDMYLAEMEYGDSVLQPGKYISGNLYQEQQT